MKKLGLFVAFVISLAIVGAGVSYAEDAATVDMPAVEQATVVDELAPVKQAWDVIKDTDLDLAAKLEKIVNGDKTDASAALTEAANAVKAENADLATQLEKLAVDWAKKA